MHEARLCLHCAKRASYFFAASFHPIIPNLRTSEADFPVTSDGSLIPLLALPLAFLSGSLPTALIMGRLRGIDIRAHGSGNIGATNAFRVLGKSWGLTCLLIDALKGWLPVAFLGGALVSPVLGRPDSLAGPTWALVTGLAAIAGHSFSPWVGFKGGKGVATSLGVFLAVAPIPMLICFALGATIIAVTGYVSVASISGAFLLPVLMILLPSGGERAWPVIGLTAALGAFVIWKHKANIGRLIAGTESRIQLGRRNPRGASQG